MSKAEALRTPAAILATLTEERAPEADSDTASAVTGQSKLEPGASLASSLTSRGAGAGAVAGALARLGDAAINAANCTARHNRAMGALFTAMRAGTPAGNTVRLGDKGDGSAASREEARQRQSWLNRFHIPDIIRFGGRIDLFEVKCYTPFRTSRGALGHGSACTN